MISQPSAAQVGNPVSWKNGVVSSADEYASKAGLEILQKGGNAVDAAVAVQFALSVTLPRAGNIGGGGFLVLHLQDGTAAALDFREKAPIAASRDMYLNENGEYVSRKSKIGHLAAGIPGTVDGMITALERYGTLPLEIVMEPAIRLAREGFILSHSAARSLNSASERLSEYRGSADAFLKPGGTPWEPGDLFLQPDLAETLERIATLGRRGFYSGITASLIVEEMKRGGGLITMRDLRDYRSIWREPVRTNFRGYELIMMPPPSSGGIVMTQVLGMINRPELDTTAFNSAAYIHLISEALRRSFADRNYWLGDPDFVPVPADSLTSPHYLRLRMQSFSPDTASDSERISHGDVIHTVQESSETTHFNVADRFGNVVSVNTTLNGSFGSFVTVTGAGFLLNNEMDDFSAKPGEPNMFGLIGAEANSIQGGKRMLSSMNPVIALKDGRFRFAGGAAGGPRIITAVLQNFLNMALFGMNAKEAIAAPRFHHQWLPDQILVENLWFSEDTIEKLNKMGHNVRRSGNLAIVHTIASDQEGNYVGAADPRGPGYVAGY
ncbi:gamma-glutamyltransferase [Rhodohalobacter mucosus]|uniref:Glutathione hydrolase proenzyme n=1 Tax=Rhodohalobacter mucosus TaxID=2079485 RepID=A0A316TQ97_9BACT|nr:gamma-glutamyltransferase [Rhodohalobacter mucosus]PWN06793.1 gamma-glutamyltransferase [Rhodohalobacter mucosus]